MFVTSKSYDVDTCMYYSTHRIRTDLINKTNQSSMYFGPFNFNHFVALL